MCGLCDVLYVILAMRRAFNFFPNEIKRRVVTLLSGSVCLLCVKLKSKIFLPTPLQAALIINYFLLPFFFSLLLFPIVIE